MHRTRSRSRDLRAALVAGTAFATLAGLAPAAGAATATTKQGAGIFCAQLRNSQTAIAGVPATAKDRLARIAAEWTKIDRFAPSTLKKDTAAILAAYRKAATQSATAAKATLAGIATAGQRVTAFASANCPAAAATGGPDGRGGRGPMSDAERAARLAELQACMKKQGVAMPDLGALGRGPGGGNGGGRGDGPTGAGKPAGAKGNGGPGGGGRSGPRPTLDARTQTALAACGFGRGDGDGRGRGGLVDNPQLQACIKAKGITLPSMPARQPGQGGGQRPQLDDKTRAAVQACRQELGLGGPGGPGGRGPGGPGGQPPAGAPAGMAPTSAAPTTAAPTTSVAA